MKRLVVVMGLLGCMGLVGCRTQERVVEVVRTDTLIQTKVQRDSVYIEKEKHDSVYIHQKGDTLLIEKWHTEWRDRWRDREKHDTLYVAKHDTIQQTLTKTDVKEKPLSYWQRVRMTVGDLALWLLAIFLLFLVVKYVVLKAVRP
jgi:hypothetical protein